MNKTQKTTVRHLLNGCKMKQKKTTLISHL
nr:MAG TPA: hypothetical protein [Caudoviricetes sp.]